MKNRTNKQKTGDFGERYAANYLRLHGYTVKERNWRSGHHEIDIIATRLGVIAFVEVKTRTYTPETIGILAPPGNAVKADKKRATRHAAQQYLYEHYTKKKPRMDVIEIWAAPRENGKKPKVLRIRHITGAY